MDFSKKYRDNLKNIKSTIKHDRNSINELMLEVKSFQKEFNRLCDKQDHIQKHNDDINKKVDKIYSKYPNYYSAYIHPDMTKTDANKIHKLDSSIIAGFTEQQLNISVGHTKDDLNQAKSDLKNSIDKYADDKSKLPNIKYKFTVVHELEAQK